MNKNSNKYIIIYSTVMVVIVALVLAFASLSLQGKQDENVVVEKRGDILRSIGQAQEADKVKDKAQYIDQQYARYIRESYVVDYRGYRVEGEDAFALLRGLKEEYDKPVEERNLPVFVADVDGTELIVLPLWGKGLWGPVWGYVALEGDWSTVSGVVFDHQGETPGLGAEITDSKFRNQFVGKSIFKEGKLVSIAVLKGDGISKDNPNAVDAVSGGTITSRGVGDMIKDSLGGYAALIEKQHAAASAPASDTQTANID